MAAEKGTKEIVYNRKARHLYHFLEQFEAGIVLTGTEVKSLRGGRCNLVDSYAQVKGGELYLQGLHISPYEHGNRFNPEPERSRKLLMHKREIVKLYGRVKQEGLTLVPLRLYFKAGKVKVELALARGKKDYDKRETKREREAERRIARALKERA